MTSSIWCYHSRGLDCSRPILLLLAGWSLPAGLWRCCCRVNVTLFSRVTVIRKLQSTSDFDHFHARELPCSRVKSCDDPISGRRGDSGVPYSFIYRDLMLFLGELVVWHQKSCHWIMKKKCLPLLYYAITVCPLNKAHISSLDFAVGSCFSKIFCIKSRETITECMRLFNCQSIKDVADKIRQNFVKKYSVSWNGLYKLFTVWCLFR